MASSEPVQPMFLYYVIMNVPIKHILSSELGADNMEKIASTVSVDASKSWV